MDERSAVHHGVTHCSVDCAALVHTKADPIKLSRPVDAALRQTIAAVIATFPEIKLAIVFGSLAKGTARPDSDLDIAVAAERPLPAERKLRLIEALAIPLGRPVDLVDLRTAGYFVMQQALRHGEMISCTDRSVLAEVGSRMVCEREDFAPYVRRALRERRRAWIGT